MPVLTTPVVLFGQVYIPAISNIQNGFELGQKTSLSEDKLTVKWDAEARWLVTGYPTVPKKLDLKKYDNLKTLKLNSLVKNTKPIKDIALFMVSAKHEKSPWLYNFYYEGSKLRWEKPITLQEIPIIVTDEDEHKDLTALRQLQTDASARWQQIFMVNLFSQKFYVSEGVFSFRELKKDEEYLKEIDNWVDQNMKPGQ